MRRWCCRTSHGYRTRRMGTDFPCHGNGLRDEKLNPFNDWEQIGISHSNHFSITAKFRKNDSI
jgi:hypothetical protein